MILKKDLLYVYKAIYYTYIFRYDSTNNGIIICKDYVSIRDRTQAIATNLGKKIGLLDEKLIERVHEPNMDQIKIFLTNSTRLLEPQELRNGECYVCHWSLGKYTFIFDRITGTKLYSSHHSHQHYSNSTDTNIMSNTYLLNLKKGTLHLIDIASTQEKELLLGKPTESFIVNDYTLI